MASTLNRQAIVGSSNTMGVLWLVSKQSLPAMSQINDDDLRSFLDTLYTELFPNQESVRLDDFMARARSSVSLRRVMKGRVDWRGMSGYDGLLSREEFVQHCFTARSGAEAQLRLKQRLKQRAFLPTNEFQRVFPRHICPAGLEYRVDLSLGTTWARLLPTPA
jgi:hypothetical protein